MARIPVLFFIIGAHQGTCAFHLLMFADLLSHSECPNLLEGIGQWLRIVAENSCRVFLPVLLFP